MKRLRHPVRAVREPFGTAGLVVACVALILALTGAAFAAAGLTGKQKKEVEKIAKKFAGKPGAPGAQGAAGSAGAKGDPGAPGTNGTNGKSVTVSAGASSCFAGEGATVEVEGQPGTAQEICNGIEGEPGAEGQPAGFNYVFSGGTGATDPGTGKLALNNAASGSATTLSISATDHDGNGLEKAIEGWLTGASSQGILLIRKAGDPTVFAEYAVRGGNACEASPSHPTQCAMVNEGAYENIQVRSVAGHGTFAANDEVTIAYWSQGVPLLPIGAEETGTFAFSGTQVENGKEEGAEGILVPISFSIPLTPGRGEIERDQIFAEGESGFSEHCASSVSAAQVTSALYGTELKTTICIFGVPHNAELTHVWKLALEVEVEGANRTGAILQFNVPDPGLAYASGSWAVQKF